MKKADRVAIYPFVAKTLKEERARRQDVNVNVRLNEEWQEILRQVKERAGIEKDSEALKIGLQMMLNALQSQFSGRIKVQLSLGRQPKNKEKQPKA